MIHNIIRLQVIILMLFYGCNENNTAVNETVKFNKNLSDEIMRIHDDAMQYQSYLLKLKRSVHEKIDTVQNQSLKDSLIRISAQLYAADRKMLEWMHHYKQPDLSHDSAKNYLIHQKQLIDEVHKLTFEAKNNAEIILKIK